MRGVDIYRALRDHPPGCRFQPTGRTSLKPISDGIDRDLIPAEAKAFSENIELSAADRRKAEQLVRALHERGDQITHKIKLSL